MPDRPPDSTASHDTIRYYASSRYAYARAVLELVAYARSHGEEFEVSPGSAAEMEHQGLAVSGEDLAGVRELLGGVEGLVIEDGEDSQGDGQAI